jgi:hypothetical protein
LYLESAVGEQERSGMVEQYFHQVVGSILQRSTVSNWF